MATGDLKNSPTEKTPAKSTVTETNPEHRKIRSFVLRQGRLTTAQENALSNHWQDYGIDYNENFLDFNHLFKNNNDVIIEIGFGNGESLLQQAIKQPDYNFIGIEVHGPGVGHLIHNAVTQNMHNLKVIRHDAVEVLTQQIPAHSVQQLQLFFPDPWHKKRHNKRRIINPDFIQLALNKLKSGGFFHMATDWQHYADQMLAQMDSAQGFENTAGKGHFSETQGARCETRFERRGVRLGHGVWDLIYQKTE